MGLYHHNMPLMEMHERMECVIYTTREPEILNRTSIVVRVPGLVVFEDLRIFMSPS